MSSDQEDGLSQLSNNIWPTYGVKLARANLNIYLTHHMLSLTVCRVTQYRCDLLINSTFERLRGNLCSVAVMSCLNLLAAVTVLSF